MMAFGDGALGGDWADMQLWSWGLHGGVSDIQIDTEPDHCASQQVHEEEVRGAGWEGHFLCQRNHRRKPPSPWPWTSASRLWEANFWGSYPPACSMLLWQPELMEAVANANSEAEFGNRWKIPSRSSIELLSRWKKWSTNLKIEPLRVSSLKSRKRTEKFKIKGRNNI